MSKKARSLETIFDFIPLQKLHLMPKITVHIFVAYVYRMPLSIFFFFFRNLEILVERK
jgi:hypothetical protein